MSVTKPHSPETEPVERFETGRIAGMRMCDRRSLATLRHSADLSGR